MAYSNTLPKLEDYTSLSNIKSVIAVSNNQLALINSSDGSVKSMKDLTFFVRWQRLWYVDIGTRC